MTTRDIDEVLLVSDLNMGLGDVGHIAYHLTAARWLGKFLTEDLELMPLERRRVVLTALRGQIAAEYGHMDLTLWEYLGLRP